MPAPRPTVPVFPLPGVVLFPHAVLPLHVFELRYRTLVRDALSNGRRFALATLQPGWEADYQGSPAFHELACIARFDEVVWRENDCYDLRVRGTERVRLERVAREFPYRACEFEVLPQSPYDEDDPLGGMERAALLEVVNRMLPLAGEAWWQPPLEVADARLETFVNTIAQAARIDARAKLELLAIDSVFERAMRLREVLARWRGGGAPGPASAQGHN